MNNRRWICTTRTIDGNYTGEHITDDELVELIWDADIFFL